MAAFLATGILKTPCCTWAPPGQTKRRQVSFDERVTLVNKLRGRHNIIGNEAGKARPIAYMRRGWAPRRTSRRTWRAIRAWLCLLAGVIALALLLSAVA